MDDYTTILVRKKTRDKLARLKRYRRESYDETIGRMLSGSAPMSQSDAEVIRQALERHDRLRATASKSGKAVEKEIKEAQEGMEREWSHVP